MEIRRIRQASKYGWNHAKEICEKENLNVIRVFFDIMYCFFRYNLWSNQYKKEKLWSLQKDKRKVIALEYKKENDYRDDWVKDYFKRYAFLYKWGSLKNEISAKRQEKRRFAYKKFYHLAYDCFIGFDVIIQKHHYSDSSFTIGKNCHIAEHANLDYTGGLTFGNKVELSEGVKILTHNHDYMGTVKDKSKYFFKTAYKTPLIIDDDVWFGTHVMVNPGVGSIGRKSILAAGSVVKKSVPPYAIMMGNPAKIVGFSMRPDEAYAYECEHYSEGKRIPLETLEKNYKKYFIDRLDEIKSFTKI